MSPTQPTASLFQTSLREWQADWKARRDGKPSSQAPAAGARRLIRAAKAKRLGRRQQAVTGG